MEIGHCTFDQNLKARMTRPRGAHAGGPFYQLMAYQFGSFRILVRCLFYPFSGHHLFFEIGRGTVFTEKWDDN